MEDPTQHLPLQILRSDPNPSAPNRPDPPGSAVDWLPDFLDLSWVAYGASSLLVLSHFPSPISDDQAAIGPIFRQVFELSGNPSATVKSVAWSPSDGDLAAAAENCVWLFSHDSAIASKGSFCWSQNAVLVHSGKVEAIGWTGSGDGVIAVGIEVALWKRSGRSWEIAWKFRTDQPQSLVSATWSVEGPFATATYQSKWLVEGLLAKEASKFVLVSQRDGKSGFVKSELQHPLPVSFIQWRPLTGRSVNGDAKHPPRNVLLTCCLDGTVRLWCEVDGGRARKVAKDTNDHKTMKWSFSVAAVIEINQELKGILGTEIYVMWATETGDLYKTSAGAKQLFSEKDNEHDQVANCEWLIGFGPGMLVNFWAVHCLDDVSPIRFPRVTLWKTREQQVLEGGHFDQTGQSNYKDKVPINKVVISRSCLSGPPTVCSMIQLLPCNSLVWSLLYTQTIINVEDSSVSTSGTENTLSSSAVRLLNLDGHAERILQVAVHPYSYEVELAVSLDANGLLLFWFFSTISNCNLGRPTLIPTWELCGKLVTQSSCSKYTSLRWAPSIVNEVVVLLMGHAGGIDCFIVKIHQNEEEIIEYHYLCTIPFTGHGPYEDGPTSIYTIPLPSTCQKTLISSTFMLLGVWMNGFQALSWEITLHSFDLSGSSCECNSVTGSASECSTWEFEGIFANKRYCLNVNPCSSKIPDPHNHDDVTSFGVICLGNSICVEKNLAPTIDPCSSCSPYLMATGCSDGSLKLWKSSIDKPLTAHISWELVGMFVAHQGPICAICLSDCGRKIATACNDFPATKVGTLRIWDSVHLVGVGTFMLEDTLSFDQELVTLKWLPLGNGQLLLGVCTQHQLRVYSPEHCGGQTLLNPEKSVNKNIWVCIASTHTFAPICDFYWGPRATAVFVHDRYFSVNSQWLFLVDKKYLSNGHPNDITKICMDSVGGMEEDTDSSIFFDYEIYESDRILLAESSRDCKSGTPLKTDLEKDYLSSSLFAARSRLNCGWTTKMGLWTMLEVVEKLSGSLPVYHPEALFMNIYSGNWKRAYIALRHLNDFLSSSSSCERKHRPSKSSNCVPQISLATFLYGTISTDSNDKGNDNGFQWSGNASLITSPSQFQTGFGQFASSLDSYASTNPFNSPSTKYGLGDIVEPLEKLYGLAAITNFEKMQILAIIDLLNEITNSNSGSVYESLDEHGRRFWIALRFQQLHFFRKFGRLVSAEEFIIDYKLIGWAYHSDCQENLFVSFLPNEPSWQEMRNLGVGFWFTNTTQLRSRMEKLARLQYLKRKDPKDCALLYIALNRIQVLTGLFKISRDEKDKPLVGFLSRNFQEEKNKAAALKNAYVLMGRHQLELAIAFFLLGGDTSSAVSICAKNLGDEQLAVVICRLIEGRGGPLERHLILKSILPSAIERGDYWLASLLEWELGNYLKSFISMLGFQTNSATQKYALSSKSLAFSDPNIGMYCLMLAGKNNMRNSMGELSTAILNRWAVFATATALNRCGLPLEALEYLSSLTTILGDIELGRISDIGHSKNLHGFLNPSPKVSSNWLSGNVVCQVELQARFNLALQYISALVREHPSFPNDVFGSSGDTSYIKECEHHEHVNVLEGFRHKLYTSLHHLEQKFSVVPLHLINMVLISLYNHGLWFVGYDILHGYISRHQELNKSQIVNRSLLRPLMHKPFLKVTRETSLLFSRVIAACSITRYSTENNVSGDSVPARSNAWGYYFQGVIQSLGSLRTALQIISVSSTEDVIMKPLTVLDLIEYFVQFSYAWLQQNSEVLFLLLQPLLITFTNGHTPYEVNMVDLKKLLARIAESMAQNSMIDNVSTGLQDSQGIAHLVPEDERWKIIGACLWQHISRFMKHKLNMLSFKLDEGCFSGVPTGKHFSWVPEDLTLDDNSLEELIGLVSLTLVKLLKTTVAHTSSYHVKRLASHLQHKMDNGLHVMTPIWLEESNQSQTRVTNQQLNQDMPNSDKGGKYGSGILWGICADPKIISESFTQEKITLSHSHDHKHCKRWKNIYRGTSTLDENEEIHNHELTPKNTSANSEAGSPPRSLFRSGHSFLSAWQKDTTLVKEDSPFLNPKEIYKRNGELVEALCLNSINQKQAAMASNRKGILFFNWEDDMSYRNNSDYIWTDADWPLNGWAGSESTPAPTYVSPGVGLGSKKGTHLGLGGATVGVGSLAKPARDLTGGGVFGIPGYAGTGVSGLGWEIRDDIEELVDPPPTLENANTRAFSSHPSRSLFLVGSSNTHVYLWEFGKDKATATYGVLPAANVPPPYALASISALQFDHCGHRFATAALDGTVCTWQLEVGGRSNISPTESSLCFNSHASDVAYFTSSGSIIAVAGYSSNSVNVVIWDTLAPPTTSRASIICHEGGARSLSVFDNDIGSGSVSPLIVTGGKGGDVGLHDFRYIATGRSKRHRHTDKGEQPVKTSSSIDLHTGDGTKFGEQNQNGMLWYIPKAHSGSVTKISIIPNTSLFLTGSKDGDVKLWDAKKAKLVYHWPKLHERHTFLQPSSRGFGGVVQAAVTDIKVVSQGFLTCGGDGTVKLVCLKDHQQSTL